MTTANDVLASLGLPEASTAQRMPGLDATYVALAELAGATALLTTDARLARAPGVQCRVEVD